ncbi:hypothetical protein [Streptomyces avermitilis]|uniref:hypothetical protein n=1 Tax=Streptomyces avermitilis TaxID=33903 RepID=UPI0036A7C647
MINQRYRCEDVRLPGDILSHETLHQDPQVNADEEGYQRLVSSDGSWTYFTADCAWIGSDLRGRMLRYQRFDASGEAPLCVGRRLRCGVRKSD